MNPRLHDLDRARAYHHASKHTWQRVRREGRTLDWANQPSPFRRYDGAPVVELPRRPATLDVRTDDLLLGRVVTPPAVLDLTTVSRLLWHSVAVSAWKRQTARDGSVHRWSLRVNPSSGNLHPTETYLATRGAQGLEDGLWHYRADTHALELRRRGDAVRPILETAGRSEPAQAVLVLTSVFWREAWKYETRAYRYCALDAGHAAHALVLAARALGLATEVVLRFVDEALARVLAVEGGDEVPFLIIPILPPPQPSPAAAGEGAALGPALGIPNRLSEHEVSWPLIDAIDLATKLDEDDLPLAPTSRPRAEPPPAFLLPEGAPLAAPFGEVARRRRSALDFDPAKSALELEELAAMPAIIRGMAADQPITLYLWAHNVLGLGPGLYRAARDGRGLSPIDAASDRSRARYLSLEQDIAGDGALAMSIVGDIEESLEIGGCRGYRDLIVRAGYVGHALYLVAEALGKRATGIGAFYDDDVCLALGLDPSRDGQPLYHFALGAPVEDPRLVGEEEPLG
jgi:SagB-type dehydrogenase family enzyme